MRNIDQRLQRAQQEQGARQDDLESGRVKVERPTQESSSSQGQKKNT